MREKGSDGSDGSDNPRIWVIVCRAVDVEIPDATRVRGLLKEMLRRHGMRALEITAGEPGGIERVLDALGETQAREAA